MPTLKEIRYEILKEKSGGADQADRKTQNLFWDQLIFDTRAMMIPMLYAKGGIDPQWIQTIDMTVKKVTDGTGGISFVGNTLLPTLIDLPENLGLYRIHNMAKGTHSILQFERQNTTKAGLAKYDRITGHRTKVSTIGNQLEIRTKVTLSLNIKADLIMHDCYDDPNFTQDKQFPFSPNAIKDLIGIIFEKDLGILSLTKNGSNDSQEDFATTPKSQAKQQ